MNQISKARKIAKPRPAPTPMPILAPVLRLLLLLLEDEPALLFSLVSMAVEMTDVSVVGVPFEVVAFVMVLSTVEVASEEPLLRLLPPDEPLVLMGSVLVGRKPPCQSRLSPVAVGKLTTLASTEASLKRTVRDVSGHQQGFVVVTVSGPRLFSQPTHSLLVPLQYVAPTQASPTVKFLVSLKQLWVFA
jgi:hypothetical protein